MRQIWQSLSQSNDEFQSKDCPLEPHIGQEWPCPNTPVILRRWVGEECDSGSNAKVYPAGVTTGRCQLRGLLTAEKQVLFGGILSSRLPYGCHSQFPPPILVLLHQTLW